MTQGTVVVLGKLVTELSDLAELCGLVSTFGWSVEMADDLKQLRCLATDRRIVAILLDAPALGITWDHALTVIRKIVPRALPIVCHRFSDKIQWPELAEAGAFHALAFPLSPSEVRQSLSFVSTASRDRYSENVRAMRQIA